MDHRLGNKRRITSLISFIFLAFTIGAYAQPPNRPPLPRPLLYKLQGPAAFKERLAAQKDQASKPATAPLFANKCNPDSCEQLRAKARKQGTINIIVLLNIPNLPDESRISQPKREETLKLRRGAIKEAQERTLKHLALYKTKVGRKFDLTPGFSVTVNSAALEDLIANPEVEGIQENLPEQPMLPESVPQISADKAAINGFTGSGYTIAILDTGVDGTHSFLTNKITAEACFSTNGTGTNPEYWYKS